MFFLGLISFAYQSLGGKIVEYRLGYNYGEVFHDFSGNSRDGVNGDSSTTTLKNTIATDRGAYFGQGDYEITLPPNDQQATAFTLPSTFTVAAWILSHDEDGMLFYRYKDSNNYFYCRRTDSSNKITGRVVIGGSDSSESTGASSSWNAGKDLFRCMGFNCSCVHREQYEVLSEHC